MKTAAETLAIRDRLLTALLQAEGPMSTSDVCNAAGPRIIVRPCAEARGSWHPQSGNTMVRLVSCDGTTDIVAQSLVAMQIGYQQLVWLAAHGLTERLRFTDQRSVFWTSTALAVERDAQDLDELESIWEMS